MKTKIFSALIIAGFMGLSTAVMAQDDMKAMQNDSNQKINPKMMMKKMDKNSDSMISMDEANAAEDKMLSSNFDKADTSKDGMIDMTELKAYHKSMKKGMKGEKSKMKKDIDSIDY